MTPEERIQAAKKHSAGEDVVLPPDDEEREPEAMVFTVQELLEEAAVRARSREQNSMCTTGHYLLDALTGGMRRGHSWVFAAESSWGKSSFLISVADENLKVGKRVLIVSFEDPPSIYGDRLLCRRAGISAMRLRDKRLTDAELESVKDVVAKAEQVPVYVEGGNIPIERLVRIVEQVIKRDEIDVVAWDYLQEAKTSRRHQDERVRFRETAALMRDVGRRLGCSTLILSQITEQTGKKYPDKNSVRECRDVSNAAEHILIGFTPEEDLTEDNKLLVKAGTKCIKVDKSKDGRKGTVAALWDEESACFKPKYPPAGSDYTDVFNKRDEYQSYDNYQPPPDVPYRPPPPDDTETRYP